MLQELCYGQSVLAVLLLMEATALPPMQAAMYMLRVILIVLPLLSEQLP
jgi:hypothetical protein